MRSALPKVLHQAAGRTLLAHVLDAVRKAAAGATVVVIGPDHDAVAQEAKRIVPDAQIAVQHERRGTAHAVLEAGMTAPRDGMLVQEGAAGLLPLRVHGEGRARTIAVRTPPARVMEVADAGDPRLEAALPGLPHGVLPPVLMDGGRRWWLLDVAGERALRAARPDWAAIERLAHDTGSMGVFAYARSDDPVYYLAVRAFVGAPAPFEDAASGAANATLAAWLAERDALPGEGGFYRVSQGREVGHDAIIELDVDADRQVWSGGRACTVVRGMLDWDRPTPP